MAIIEDSRQQVGKHEQKHTWWAEQKIPLIRCKIVVGDYCKPPSISVDTKAGLLEIAQNIGGGKLEHKRFIGELKLAQELGCKLFVLIENNDGVCSIEDVRSWKNPRLDYYPQAITGERLAKAMKTIESRYGCTFAFCRPQDAAERIEELLNG